MSETRPFGFKKAGVKELLLHLLLVPFIGVGLGFGWATLHAWRHSRAVEAHEVPSMSAEARGRVLVHGQARRHPMISSPLGQRGVGWVGAVGYMEKDGEDHPQFKPVCVRGDLSEIRIRSSDRDWSLTFVTPSDPVVLGSRSKLEDALPIVDIGDPVAQDPPAPIPDVLQRACGASLTRTKEPLSYREAVLAADAPIEVLGCRDGQRMTRCDDGGLHLLTSSTVRALKASSRTGLGVIMLFGGFWNLVIMGVAGLAISRRIVRSKPTFQERLRLE